MMQEVEQTRWRAEAIRLFERYQYEMIEAFGLCPYAVQARRLGQVQTEVIFEDTLDGDDVLVLMDAWAADPSVEIGFLICPRAPVVRRDFEVQVETLRQRYADHIFPKSAALAMAAFHPAAVADLTSPAQLIPFMRATPDPTVQFIRLSTLEALRRRDPPATMYMAPAEAVALAAQAARPAQESLGARIGRENWETMRDGALADVEAVFASIREDRAETYARFTRAQNEV